MTTYRNVNSRPQRPQPARGVPRQPLRQRRPYPWGATCSCTEHGHDAGPPDDAGEAFYNEYEYEAPADPVVTVGSNAIVSDNALTVLKGLLREAGAASATITSGRRTAADQARIMYDNLVKYGVDYSNRMYASSGRQVVAVYSAGVAAKQTPDQIKLAMEAKINAVGPTNVSNHISGDDVFDVDPKSIADQAAFERVLVAAEQAGRIRKHLSPYTKSPDPAFHIEVTAKPAAPSGELAEFLSEAPPLSYEAYSAEFAEAEFAEAELESEADGPVCGVARPGIAALRDLLRELDVAKARTRRDSPQVMALRERIRDKVRAMIDDLPGFIERGCCAPHLAQLAVEVDRLPWDSHPRVQEAGEALRRALERARERARNHGACRH
jgi:hypothetical protein